MFLWTLLGKWIMGEFSCFSFCSDALGERWTERRKAGDKGDRRTRVCVETWKKVGREQGDTLNVLSRVVITNFHKYGE